MENNESRRLLSLDEVWDVLNRIAKNIPEDIFKHLNGGIVLLPDTVLSPHSRADDLYTMGSYHYEPYGLGRYININYGSFAKVYRGATIAKQEQALRDVLYHEFVHHLESLAGVRDLEEWDRQQLERYFTAHTD